MQACSSTASNEFFKQTKLQIPVKSMSIKCQHKAGS